MKIFEYYVINICSENYCFDFVCKIEFDKFGC